MGKAYNSIGKAYKSIWKAYSYIRKAHNFREGFIIIQGKLIIREGLQYFRKVL